MQLTSKQWAALGALTLAAGTLAYVAYADLGKNLVYYLTPPELLAKGPQARGMNVRLGGLVQTGSILWNPQTLELSFSLGMLPQGGASVAVHSSGTPPQMFQQGTGAVVEGQFDGQIFHAERLMVKHSNEYRPPAPGERPKDVLGTLAPPDSHD